MAYSLLPIAGIQLGQTATVNLNSAGVAVPTVGPLGLETFGSDGLRYVFAQLSEVHYFVSISVVLPFPAGFISGVQKQ